MKHWRLLPGEIFLAMVAMSACGGRADTPVPTTTIGATNPATSFPTVAPVAPENLTSQPGSDAMPELVLIDSFRGDVQPEAQAIFGLTGQAGDPIRIEAQVHLGEPDLALQLNTPDGQVLAKVNVGGPGQSEVIGEFRFPTDGYYELAVQSREGTGQVDVLVYRLPSEALSGGGVIPGFNQPVTGSIEHPATFHTFQLQVERGQRFDIGATALSGDLDLVFELYDPQGESVALRDDTIGYDPYLFNHMPSISGVYTLVLTNYEQTTGTYQVIAEASRSGGQLVFGQREVLTLSREPSHGTWLTFVGTGGEALSVEARPINPSTNLALAVYDVYGNRLAYADLGGPGVTEFLGEVQLPYDGPYQLEFDTLTEGGELEYLARSLSFYEIGEVGGPIVPGPRTERTVAIRQTGTVHTYWFEGEAGQLVTIDAESTAGALDLAFGLYDLAGNLLTFHDDDRNRDPVVENFALPVSGPYYLVLSTLGDNVGEYRLKVNTPSPADQASEGV